MLIGKIALIAVVLMAFSAKASHGAELLTNGSFETGTFTGWTATNGGGAFFNWTVSTPFDTGFHVSSPRHGTRSAWNGVAGNAGATFTLVQQFTIPAASTASIQWYHRFQLDNASFCSGSACGSATFAVELLNTSNVLLQTLYTRTTGPATILDTGWQPNYRSLDAYAGQTIRIRFRNTVTATLAGPGMAEIDNVRVQTPGIVPSAGTASISGKLTDVYGSPIRSASVSLMDTEGNVTYAASNPFGYYKFDGVPVGRTYVLAISHKRYTFDGVPFTISVFDDTNDLNFQARE